MVTGQLPFEADNKALLYKLIINCDFENPKNLTEELRDFLSRILIRSSRLRLNFEEIGKHRWFGLYPKEKSKENGFYSSGFLDEYLMMITAVKLGKEFGEVKAMVEKKMHNKVTTL
jgi:serine/threonine protein kinase